MRLANPQYLIVFLLLLALIYTYVNVLGKKYFKPFVKFSQKNILDGETPGVKGILLKVLNFLKYFALLLIIIALARPQEGKVFEYSNDRGIDIMIALDTSSSMKSLDFKPLNRMEAAKKVTESFIKGRKFDRIGLTVFAGLAFTQSPLTTDKESLAEFVRGVNIGDTGLDGTAIGSAIMTSAGRLKDSSARSRIIILITDGINNMGEIDPVTAAKIAASYGIRIYAVGVGSPDGAVYVVDDPFFGQREIRDPNDKINESALREIAKITGGEYFRATDVKSFENVMRKIDALEKDEIKVTQRTNYKELYKGFVIAALLILLLAAVLGDTWLRKIP